MVTPLAFGVASCSVLLNWNGYTADPGEGGAAADSSDASTAPENDAASEGALANDGSRPDVLEAGPQGDGPPPCALTCQGCCTRSGVCSGGASSDNCGSGGRSCQSCASMGLACVGGVCSAPSADGGTKTCVATSCPNVCIPYWQGTCCNGNSCGCMALIPQGPCM
jgi:hypothetical protein